MKHTGVPIPYIFECANTLSPQDGVGTPNKGTTLYKWQTKNSSPKLKLDRKPFLSGWYMLELCINSNLEYLDAAISCTIAGDTKKIKHYPILVINGRTAKRVVYLPDKISAIYLIPCEKIALININSIRFVKLTTQKALKLMHKKLLTFQPDNKFNYSIQLWRHYQQLLENQQKSEADYDLWVEKREYSILKRFLHIDTSLCFTVILDISSDVNSETMLNQLLSLERQTYPFWDLILIINPGSSLCDEVNELLHRIEHRVLKVLFCDTKIKNRVSDLLKHSKVNYFFYFQKDTILSPYALSVFSREVENDNVRSIIYADEDFLDESGKRFDPIFKPDWNPDLLLSNNYIGESIIIHRSLLVQSERMVIDPLSIWIYELLIITALSQEHVKHISLILSHKLKTARDYASDKGKQQLHVLKKHLKILNASARQGKSIDTFRVQWPVNGTAPLVSIIIPTRDGLTTLERAVSSILEKTNYANFELIIVDNQSKRKETLQYLQHLNSYGNVRVVSYNKPFNYSAINNYASQFAQGSIIALLNNDIEVINSGWLKEMVSHCQRKEIGCVGAMLYYPDDRIQHAGVIIGLGGCAGHSHKFYKKGDSGYSKRLICTQNYSAVTGACLLVRKSVFDEVNGLNEEHLKVAFNDVDFCLKVQSLGYRNLWTPWSELYHYESLSRGKDDTKEKRQRLNKEVAYMRETWNTTSTSDPYYNRFLTHIREDFSLGL